MEELNYGGFVATKNVRDGKPIGFAFREESPFVSLNGWYLYSGEDDDEFVKDPENFVILDASQIKALAPAMLDIYDAGCGTEVSLMYEEGVHTGFYDLKNECVTTVDETLRRRYERDG